MKYAFFPGCAQDTSAGYKESLDSVCQKLEIELLEIPDWNCCGATITAGESKTSSLYLAARSFALSEKMGYTDILTGCNACYTTLRKSADYLFSNAHRLEEANQHLKPEGLELTKEVTVRHIMDIIFKKTPETVWAGYKDEIFNTVNIACYYGCQYTRPWLKGLDSENPRFLENAVKNLGFNAVDHSAKTICCGAAGAMPSADIAETLVGRIADCVIEKSADALITICPLCQFNVDSLQTRQGKQKIPILFFTQLLGLYFKIDPAHLGLDKLLIKPDTLIRKLQLPKSS